MCAFSERKRHWEKDRKREWKREREERKLVKNESLLFVSFVKMKKIANWIERRPPLILLLSLSQRLSFLSKILFQRQREREREKVLSMHDCWPAAWRRERHVTLSCELDRYFNYESHFLLLFVSLFFSSLSLSSYSSLSLFSFSSLSISLFSFSSLSLFIFKWKEYIFAFIQNSTFSLDFKSQYLSESYLRVFGFSQMKLLFTLQHFEPATGSLSLSRMC